MEKKPDAAQFFDDIIEANEEIIKSGTYMLSCAEVMVQALQGLKELYTSPAAATPQETQPAETPDSAQEEKTYNFQEVRGIMAGLAGKGKKAEARALLQKFGITRLSELDEKDYGALVKEAKVIEHG